MISLSLFRGRGNRHHGGVGAGKYKINMCSGPILPKMLLFAVPLMFSGILQLLFTAADIIVVGRFAGDNSLAAVGSNAPIIGMMTNLFIGISIGTNVLVSRYLGSKDSDNIAKTVSTSIVMAIVSGIFLNIVGVVFARKILIFIHSPQEVLPLSTLYLVIYSFCMTPMMLYNFGSAILRAKGDTRRPLFYLIFAGIINVTLNVFFVVHLHLDVAGVGIATLIAQCISASLVIRCLARETGSLRLVRKHLRIDPMTMFRVLRIGVPAGFQGVLFSVSNVVIQSSINTFGAIAMAGSCASDNIELFIFFAMEAFYQAIISFVSQNIGARRVDRVVRVMKTGLLSIIVVGVVMGAMVLIFGRFLLGIYSTSAAVVEAGLLRMRILVPAYFVCGLVDGMAGVLRGMGYSVIPTIVTLVGICGLRIVWMMTLLDIPALHSIATIYAAYPASWVVTFGALYLCYRLVKNKVFEAAKRTE